jgi:hypothetical protein
MISNVYAASSYAQIRFRALPEFVEISFLFMTVEEGNAIFHQNFRFFENQIPEEKKREGKKSSF